MQNTSTVKLKQPVGLYYLFLVELWERFGFYVVRGLLVLYMTKVFLFTDDRSYALFGAFTALLWLTPAIGGYLADKLLGYKRSLIIGGTLLTLGYFALAISSVTYFYVGLALLIVGMGFFKANVASLMGTFYAANDPRRDGGFTIYYMGINIGGLAAAVLSGYLVAEFGWHVAFAAAGFGMLLGLIIFISGQKILGHRGEAPKNHSMLWFISPPVLLVYLGSIAVVFLAYLLLYHVAAANITLEAIGGLIILVYLFETFRQGKGDRNKMLACLVLTLFSVAFWVLYQQAPMTVNLFTERNVSRHFFGFDYTIPTVMYQSLNPFFIIVLTPILNWCWKFLYQKKIPFSTALKFTIAIFLMGVGFLVLRWSTEYFANQGIVSSWWIVLSYGLQSLGELMLQPIGLAMMTAMAPKNLSGLMVGTWFLASAAANAIAGSVAKLANIPHSALNVPMHSAAIYGHAFALYGWVAIVVALISLVLVPYLSHIMHGDGIN